MADEQPVSTEQDSVRRLAQIRARVAVLSPRTFVDVSAAFTEDVPYLLSLIDSLTAERDDAQRVAGNLLARIFRDGGHRAATYETLGEAAAVADLEVANLFYRAEAAEAEVKRLREAVMLHHEAGVLARTVGVETHEAWGMRCPVCAAALATPPSDGGQSYG